MNYFVLFIIGFALSELLTRFIGFPMKFFDDF